MSGSLTPGVNTPTIPPPAPPPGLINAAPGLTTTTPRTAPQGSGAPVTGYTPQTATATNATTAAAAPNPYAVTPNQTVVGNLKEIIASGSPLMQQAETNARNLMNQRGLINSSQAVTADQSALYSAALPIATTDAGTYATAATNTTRDQNAALAAEAAAKNTAGLQNSQLQTNTSQFNAAAGNTALGAEATASNTVAQIAQQLAGQKDVATLQSDTSKAIAKIQSDTSLSVQDKANQSSQIIAGIQANTSLTNQEKQDQTTLAVQASQAGLQTYLGDLSASTQLTLQDKAAKASEALAAVNNLNSQTIATIQSNTQLSVSEQQTASAQVVAGMNNQSAQIVQKMQNDAAMANIQANGAINTQIQTLTDANKLLLQTSAGAGQLYNQALTNLSAIMTNPNLSTDQQSAALNNGVAQLRDGLAALSGIANNQNVTSNLVFGNGSSTAGGGAGGGGGGGSAPPALPQAASDVLTNATQQYLGRAVNPGDITFWSQQVANGVPVGQIASIIANSPEAQSHGQSVGGGWGGLINQVLIDQGNGGGSG